MPVYRPSELRELLASLHTGPKKHLSQNFLIDGNILRKIVQAANVQPDDLVLEIGPGPGALTECLLDAGARVVAVEKDPVLSEALKRLNKDDKLQVYTEDIMEVSFADILPKGVKAKVIANLPYHLTAPIMGLLSPRHELFSSLHVMVQDEVARRMTAKPGTSDFSAFTVFLNFYSKPHYTFKVGRNCFYPAPKVDSAIVSLELKEPQANIDTTAFFDFVHLAFHQRRKMLRSSLKDKYGSQNVEEALLTIGAAPTCRPEELGLEGWVALFEKLN